MNREEIIREATETLEYMRKCRRYLHENAGVGFENEKAIAFIESELLKMGITPERCGKCGVFANLGKDEKCFLLRADTDALPVREETELPFACRNGNMHGCGHDMHASILLGVAKILKKHESELCTSVKLMFQSAEESLSGAKDMIDAGVLDNPRVDYALMLHVLTAVPFECGTVIVSSPGISAPSADFFKIEVVGKGCHGAGVSQGVDPIFSASQIVITLSEINSRELASGEVASLSIGKFIAGDAANVIPDKALLEGTMRAVSEEIREYMKKRLCEISKGVASSLRAVADVKFTSGCPALSNDKELSDLAFSKISHLLGEEGVILSQTINEGRKSGISGSEDFAYVSERVPSLMIAISAGNSSDGYKYPLHHPKADFDENAMINGCAAFVCMVM